MIFMRSKFLVYTTCFLLFIVPVYGNVSTTVIEEHFDSKGYWTFEYSDGRFYRNNENERIKLKENLSSVNEALHLPFCPTTEIYKFPTEVEGIIEDIPYNYYSSLESSSKYIYSLFYQGFELRSYSSSSGVILLELENEKVKCRILVYEDYIKIYMPEGGY